MTSRCCLASGFPPHHHAIGCTGRPPPRSPCTDNSPAWFVGHWREWHRGHGCDRDDGKPRAAAATTEITQHEENASTGFLTDAELRHLRAATTSGNELLVRALDELATRRLTDGARRAAIDAVFDDHRERATKFFEPLLGFCVCTHCTQLPEHKEETPNA